MTNELKKKINAYLDEYEAKVIENREAGYVDNSWTSGTWKADAYWLLLGIIKRKSNL